MFAPPIESQIYTQLGLNASFDFTLAQNAAALERASFCASLTAARYLFSLSNNFLNS